VPNPGTPFLVLVAGGTGSRFGADTPKQFLPIGGRPMILRALDPFLAACPRLHVAVVVHPDWLDHWASLWSAEPGLSSSTSGVHQSLISVPGGATRTDSVRAGLWALAGEHGDRGELPMNALAAVHDAARPFVSVGLIQSLLTDAASHGSAVPVVPVVDSIRQLSGSAPGSTSTAIDRATLRAVQTPQCFPFNALLSAYTTLDASVEFSDDATLYEAQVGPVHLSDGEASNLKVTRSVDLRD
jgi:2-C-methyl-D-erythritol 4-phosphate cytidylyltransferase